NIPMVSFHDIVCVLAAGHRALIKLSSQDKVLIPYVLDQLIAIEPAFADRINYVERLADFDAVIATGSNNSSRYFEYYFGKVPHIIRKNRTSIAIINGDETVEERAQLGVDIFSYFGLGCRNVSKIYVPKGHDMAHFFEPIESYNSIIQHHKYLNNYEYNKSIYLVNSDAHLDNGFLLTKPDTGLHSPLAVLFTEEYSSKAELEKHLQSIEEEIQCIASMSPLNLNNQVVPFGYTQFPRLWDYADGRDVMQFLCEELPNFSGN
ncbi:MAG: acyl-CoA reductase, partial [Sphingobacteriaceae bacterium]|nr:acyl-CoA reductase [Sphingobacteriaceae bacterium]